MADGKIEASLKNSDATFDIKREDIEQLHTIKNMKILQAFLDHHSVQLIKCSNGQYAVKFSPKAKGGMEKNLPDLSQYEKYQPKVTHEIEGGISHNSVGVNINDNQRIYLDVASQGQEIAGTVGIIHSEGNVDLGTHVTVSKAPASPPKPSINFGIRFKV